jgi:tetratricopeptide (TPR) repeat protein
MGTTKKILVPALALLLLSGGAGAGEPEEKKVGYSVSKWTYQRLTEAHELIGKGKYKEALKVMNPMKNRARLNQHEQALMWQTFGYIYANMEKIPQAIESFEKCLQIGALPEQTKLDLQFSLGQLYMAASRFKKAVKTLNDWMGRVKNPSPQAKYLLAMAYTQTKTWKKALYWARQAIAGVRRPKETWLQLVLSIHYELKQYDDMARVLEQLVARFPKKAYWMQLAAIYTELKREERALAVLELAYMQNMLQSHSGLMNLVSLYLHRGIPEKAARVLERGLKKGAIKRTEQTLTLLGDSWMRAREFELAAGPLGEAARIAKKGDLWVRVAQIHMEREQWAQAISAIQNALKKGNLTSPGNAQLFLGICHFNAGRYTPAQKAFQDALKHKSSRRSAEQWLKTLSLKVKALAAKSQSK